MFSLINDKVNATVSLLKGKKVLIGNFYFVIIDNLVISNGTFFNIIF